MKNILTIIGILMLGIILVSCQRNNFAKPWPVPTMTPTATVTATSTSTPIPISTNTPVTTPTCKTNGHGYCTNYNASHGVVSLIRNQAEWEAYFQMVPCLPVPASPVDFNTHRALVYPYAMFGGGWGYATIGQICNLSDNIQINMGMLFPVLPPPDSGIVLSMPAVEVVELDLQPDPVVISVSRRVFSSTETTVTITLDSSSPSTITY